MVGITEKQLELDIDVRKEQTNVSISNSLPFFQIHATGSRSSGGAMRYSFKVKNVGAASLEVKLSLEENDDVTLGTQHLAYIDKLQEHEITILNKEGKRLEPNSEYILSLTSKNIRGQTRTQVFLIRNGSPILTSTVPENL